MCRPFGFIALKTINYLAFHSFDFERLQVIFTLRNGDPRSLHQLAKAEITLCGLDTNLLHYM